MNRKARISTLLAIALVALGGCSSKPPASESKKAGPAVDTIQGQVRSYVDPTPAGDGDLNSGGPSLKLWQNKHLYRLFMRRKTELVANNYYVAEGINAQKAIDEIGDPDQGKTGYPLLTGLRARRQNGLARYGF